MVITLDRSVRTERVLGEDPENGESTFSKSRKDCRSKKKIADFVLFLEPNIFKSVNSD